MTSFKPFQGEANIHQMNALRSWIRICGNPEILVFGDVPGLAPVAELLGLTVIPDFPRGEDGRVRVDEVFAYAQKNGKFDLQVFVNGDIILMEDFIKAVNAIRLPRFMMIGQRTDVDVKEMLDFAPAADLKPVRADLIQRGELHAAWGLDYFAYVRGSIPKLPPLYVGAAGWDNLMILCCLRNRVPVVDATGDVRIFHQNHAYFGMRECASAQNNLAVAKSIDKAWLFDASDATHWLEGGVLKSAAHSPVRLARNISNLPIRRNWPLLTRRPFRLVAKIVRSVGKSTSPVSA
jgi:hypothetical protein